MPTQLKIDFSAPRITISDEKKTELLSFRIGERFKSDLDEMARAKGIDLSKLCQEYILKQYIEDYKDLLLLQINGNITVRELMAKG